MIQNRPVLSNGYAGSILVRGEVEGVESRLRDAERWLDPARSAEMVVADEEQFRALPAAIAVHRAGQARILGDVAGTMAHARRALDLVGEDDHVPRGAAAALLGLASWTKADLAAAHRWYTDAAASLEKAGYLSDVIGCAIVLADIRIAQGRLREAMSGYERGLQLATDHSPPPMRGAADAHVGISQILVERNDLDAARQHLLTSQELGEYAGLPQNRYRRRVAMARIREAEGDLDSALDLLNEAERLYVGDFHPNVRPVPAMRARVLVAQGALGEALAGLGNEVCPARTNSATCASSSTSRSPGCCWPGTRRSRRGASSTRRPRLLERLLRAAEEGARGGSVIEILVAQALAHQARGTSPRRSPH